MELDPDRKHFLQGGTLFSFEILCIVGSRLRCQVLRSAVLKRFGLSGGKESRASRLAKTARVARQPAGDY